MYSFSVRRETRDGARITQEQTLLMITLRVVDLKSHRTIIKNADSIWIIVRNYSMVALGKRGLIGFIIGE